MKKLHSPLLAILAYALVLNACNSNPSNDNAIATVDPDATAETRSLFYNLLKYQDEAIMFGHQEALAYGIGWRAEDFRSDVNDVCGKFPAVFGWDAGGIGFKSNIDSVSFTNMKNWIVTAFEKGGINTLSWHLDNPVTGEGTWDVTPAVHAIIPGGEIHEQYRKLLDKLALFLQALKTEDGTYIPVIFRPFHEHTGSWFWWGLDNCTREEFIALFRFTVEYLRDEKGLHHLLYAYSPGSFDSEDEYLERFPGTDYIDLLGYDDYHSFSTLENIPEGLATLGTLVKLGREMNKPVAYTETGLESIPIADWWTNYMLEPIKSDPEARKITYILFWRNANTKHHYAPYPGHLSADNFIRYEQDEFTWFLEDLPDMYTLNEQPDDILNRTKKAELIESAYKQLEEVILPFLTKKMGDHKND